MPAVPPGVMRFDDYTLDLQRCSLQRGDEQIELRPKAFDVLRYFVENSGRVISKQELIRAVWPALFVTDDALVQCVRDVRHALSDEAHRIIKTVPRRGYLFSSNQAGAHPATCQPAWIKISSSAAPRTASSWRWHRPAGACRS